MLVGCGGGGRIGGGTLVGWMKGWMEECGRVEQCWSNRRLVESKGVSWLRAAGSVEGHWLDEERAHEG